MSQLSLSSSQTTSFFNRDFSDAETTSSNFKKLTKKAKLRCYLWTNHQSDIFQQWWIMIRFYEANKQREKKIIIRWDEESKKSSVWEYYSEDINIIDDVSRIICNHCDNNLSHSAFENDTSHMKNHLSTQKYKNMTQIKDLTQMTL